MKLSKRTKDLSGQRFGRLTVKKPIGKTKHNRIIWHCECDCGGIKETTNNILLRGECESCGCLQKEFAASQSRSASSKASKAARAERQAHIGEKHNRLKIIATTNRKKDSKYLMKCKCDCGNIVFIPYSRVKSGRSKSCGCLTIEKTKSRTGPNHPNWNPDRKWVDKRKKVHSFMKQVIRRTLHNKDGKRTSEVLDYSKDELIAHLESSFEKGMNWSNYGDWWQIDHKIPISWFLKHEITDPKYVSALCNLQPLKVKDNLRKNDEVSLKVIKEVLPEMVIR